jgi:hypothetical protein
MRISASLWVLVNATFIGGRMARERFHVMAGLDPAISLGDAVPP